MTKLSTANQIVEALQGYHFDNAFNPYRDLCEVYDRKNSAEIRAEILFGMLERAASEEVDAIWIGRDLGYRGGRRTGLALTDDVRFSDHLERWNLNAKRPTDGPPVAERTATMVWDYLDQITANIFLWNVFPFHPHAPTDIFSNRTHNARERRFGEFILASIYELLLPSKVIAIGNDAAKVAVQLFPHAEVEAVRHPSYGGQREFSERIMDIYSLEKAEKQRRLI